jgi:hypothetical protein
MIRTSVVLLGAVLAALAATTVANFGLQALLGLHVDWMVTLRASLVIGAMIAVPAVAMHMAIRYTSSESAFSLCALTLIVGTGTASLIALLLCFQVGEVVPMMMLYMLALGVLNSLCAWLVLHRFLEIASKND